jgi:glycosyltransferase involved in cell wall biosynthesis
MGEIGRRIVEEHFTWERNAADTMRIYRQVLEAPRA